MSETWTVFEFGRVIDPRERAEPATERRTAAVLVPEPAGFSSRKVCVAIQGSTNK
jgi:hypothetical protein